MKEVGNFLLRNAIWILLGLIAIFFLNPANPEIKTILLITLIEALAIGLSAMAVFAYTKIDFIKEQANQLGYIFLGVHICVGFVVMGVYIAQFSF
ncbi:MAG TPA: hypothetical protein PLE30_03015 [Candidatus Kapabacteria bacterium]|nr:hypothetical protein [Candidatus Kapabacteria bacterium]